MQGNCTLPPASRCHERIRRCHSNERTQVLGALVHEFSGRLGPVAAFQRLDLNRRSRGLTQVGLTLISLQVAYQVYMLVSQILNGRCTAACLCTFGISIWLVALNCFWRHRTVYLFTAFMGTIGGFHAILTPQLTVGDALPIWFTITSTTPRWCLCLF